jgi:hypothetical protein
LDSRFARDKIFLMRSPAALLIKKNINSRQPDRWK